MWIVEYTWLGSTLRTRPYAKDEADHALEVIKENYDSNAVLVAF